MSAHPYLSVRGGAAAVEFYTRAFGAEELERFDVPDGRVGHSALRIAGSLVMLADEFPEHADEVGVMSPQTVGGTTVQVNLMIDDVDGWYDRAIEAGASSLRPPSDQFFGRHASLRDPFGHVWSMVRLTKA